jgi:hypothetical protein
MCEEAVRRMEDHDQGRCRPWREVKFVAMLVALLLTALMAQHVHIVRQEQRLTNLRRIAVSIPLDARDQFGGKP